MATTKKKGGSKKKATKKTTKKVGKSKMDQATLLVNKHFQKYCDGEISRKDIIDKLVNQVGLTKAGASTYFQTIKNKILDDEQ